MTVREQRDAVVAEALSWQRTPYQPAQKLKGVAADCLTFPVAVFENVGLIAPIALPTYAMQWHLHRAEERYLEGLSAYCEEIGTVPGPGPGDLVVFKFGRAYAHAAIVIAWPQIIHAVKNRGVMLDDSEKNSELAFTARKFFTLRLWRIDCSVVA